jgi:hypothetical protein
MPSSTSQTLEQQKYGDNDDDTSPAYHFGPLKQSEQHDRTAETSASVEVTTSLGGPVGVECTANKLDKLLLDDRSYRVIELPNQLEALLIHDAGTDKASAAMDVNVGSVSDVKELPRMAHVVEHLLFMGTEKVRHAVTLYSGTNLTTNLYSTPARTSTTPT